MSGGWTVVDANTNKSQPITGKTDSGATSPYFMPAPGQQDPVGKMRVSTPQALIDTDFEYGQQPTKWESISLQNARPSCYYIPQSPVTVTAITGTATADQITITFTGTIPSAVPIYIQNSTNSTINGWGYVVTGGTNTTITVFLAPGSSTTTNAAAYYNPTATYVYVGYFYTGSGIQVLGNTTAVTVTSATVITVTTVNPHGLSKGSFVYIVGTTGGTNVNGAYIVATVPTASTFTVTAAAASGTVTTTAGVTNIYARPAGYTESRSFDGGVAFSAGAAVPNSQLIRQTRRYFRYQSGKGIQFSTGTSLCPPLFVTSIVNASGTVTVTTRYNHNMTAGTTIQVVGCDQGYFNGTFTIATVPTPSTLTYTISTSNSVTATGFPQRVIPTNWYGSTNRIGFFDQQNGLFFEYDGQTLYAVWRNSVSQINGVVAVTQGSATVTGTGTQFSTQLNPGDYIVIRGQSFRVITITSDTALTVSPEYRGTTITNALVSKTVDTRVPRSLWSDPLDGTGPSGYTLDLTKMQMWYIDYSWYGAGFARFGLRTSKGQISYVYQQTNNNQRFEAYMRSGNMAAHYESNGQTPYSILTDSLSLASTTITSAIAVNTTTIAVSQTSVFNAGGGVAKVGSEKIYYSGLSATSGAGNLLGCVRGFANTAPAAAAASSSITPDSVPIASTAAFNTAGTIKVQASGTSGVIEYIAYTGKLGNMVYGLTRAQTGGQASAQAFTYSATAPIAVEYASPDTVASLSHWGSSVIMDGNFNDDKSLVFNYGTNAQLTLATSTSQVTPILAIRIAPSVDNGTTGLLGAKEIINRSQLQLLELGVVTSGPVLITLVLNGYVSGGTWTSFTAPISLGVSAVSSSLAQVATNSLNTGTLVGGESVAAAFTNTNAQTTLDLSQVRDIGNSILGGGTSNTVPNAQSGFYPDGPDILYICATNVVAAATPTILARVSWKEAQA